MIAELVVDGDADNLPDHFSEEDYKMCIACQAASVNAEGLASLDPPPAKILDIYSQNRQKAQARFPNDIQPIFCSDTPGSSVPLQLYPIFCCHFSYSSIRTYQNIIHILEGSVCIILVSS
jgi:hypothetical protein